MQGVAGMLNIAKQSTDYVVFLIWIDKVYLFSDFDRHAFFSSDLHVTRFLVATIWF